jgi:hypothetical protein
MSSDIHRNEQGTHIILILNDFVVSNGAAPWAWDLVGELVSLLSRWGHEKHSAYKSACPDSESVAQFGMQTQIQNANPNSDTRARIWTYTVYFVSFTQVLGHTGSVQRRRPPENRLLSTDSIKYMDKSWIKLRAAEGGLRGSPPQINFLNILKSVPCC